MKGTIIIVIVRDKTWLYALQLVLWHNWKSVRFWHRVPTSSPLTLCVAKTGKKSFERGNYPPPPHWDRRAIQPNVIKFKTCSALVPIWTPPINESAELTQGTLYLILYSEDFDTTAYNLDCERHGDQSNKKGRLLSKREPTYESFSSARRTEQ